MRLKDLLAEVGIKKIDVEIHPEHNSILDSPGPLREASEEGISSDDCTKLKDIGINLGYARKALKAEQVVGIDGAASHTLKFEAEQFEKAWEILEKVNALDVRLLGIIEAESGKVTTRWVLISRHLARYPDFTKKKEKS